MKTPEEIKKALACKDATADCQHCAYCTTKKDDDGWEWPEYSCGDVFADALTYIQQLENAVEFYGDTNQMLDGRIAKLEMRLSQAERERDAAVHDLEESSFCADCKHYSGSVFNEPCSSCAEDIETKKNWQWRGVCPENTKEEPK